MSTKPTTTTITRVIHDHFSCFTQKYLHDVPICAVSEEREDFCAAETEHEEEGGEDVDPEVDDDDHGEDVDCLVALLRVRVHPNQPDRPSYQPGDLEDDVD